MAKVVIDTGKLNANAKNLLTTLGLLPTGEPAPTPDMTKAHVNLRVNGHDLTGDITVTEAADKPGDKAYVDLVVTVPADRLAVASAPEPERTEVVPNTDGPRPA